MLVVRYVSLVNFVTKFYFSKALMYKTSVMDIIPLNIEFGLINFRGPITTIQKVNKPEVSVLIC